MTTTPRSIIDSVVRSVCGREIERLVRLTSGGMNEAYRVELSAGDAVVVRIARECGPWFADEAHLMAKARDVGVPTPEVLGVEQVDHDGEQLSISIQRLVPGRALDELVAELSTFELERLVGDAGELLAHVHGIGPGRGIEHPLRMPDDDQIARAAAAAERTVGVKAAAVVGRGAARIADLVKTSPAPRRVLVHGDWMPKHLLIHDGAIAGVIDWEFAGPASPAYDFAMWEVSAGAPLHDRVDLLRGGYARIADPDEADALLAAFAMAWALEKLAWRNPATPAQIRRCVEVIARHVG